MGFIQTAKTALRLGLEREIRREMKLYGVSREVVLGWNEQRKAQVLQQAQAQNLALIAEQQFRAQCEQEARYRRHVLETAFQQAKYMVTQMGFGDNWVNSAWRESVQTERRKEQKAMIEQYMAQILGGGHNAPPQKTGGIYGSARAGSDYEIHASLQGNAGGFHAMFED